MTDTPKPAKAPRPPQYVGVPTGLVSRRCRGRNCTKWIYDVQRPSTNPKTPGKIVSVPVDCTADTTCVEPTKTEPGRGLNHFQNCVDANRF